MVVLTKKYKNMKKLRLLLKKAAISILIVLICRTFVFCVRNPQKEYQCVVVSVHEVQNSVVNVQKRYLYECKAIDTNVVFGIYRNELEWEVKDTISLWY